MNDKEIIKKTIVVSFSGGRTSGLMARLIQISPLYEDYDKIYIFSNTGKERKETLDFIQRCDDEWGLGVVWVEAVINPDRHKGTRHRVIDRASAYVNTDEMKEGHPMFDMVGKYGVFNNGFPHCTRELKTAPIKSYMRSQGFKANDYVEAWGFRYDEPRRLREREGIIYPLAELKMTELLVMEFWNKQSFDLQLKQYQGNCDLCFKKSFKKRLTILKENPEVAKDWQEMENLGDRKGGDRARFDRDGLTIGNLVEMSQAVNLEMATDDFEGEFDNPALITAAQEINWDFETQCHCQSS